MSRIAQTFSAQGPFAGARAPVVDPRHGQMAGFMPNLTEWNSAANYVTRQTFCLLIEAPTGFSKLNSPDIWIGALRSLVELQCIRISGLNQGLEVETSETAAGGGGQMLEDPTNVTETRTTVTFSWNEKYGMPVARFHSAWIRNLIMDPNSKVAAINNISRGIITDLLPDVYSATMVFIEPDPTFTKVMKSWLVTNMFPKSTGDIVGRKDHTAAGEIVTYDIQYAGLAQTGLGVDAFCQTLLDGINITGANPNNRAALVNAISADVAAQPSAFGADILTQAATAVKL